MNKRWRRRGSYGIDAPVILLLGFAVLIGNLAYAIYSRTAGGLYASVIVAPFLGIWIHTTRRGKFVAWNRVLDDQSLEGSERILDLGCGRGAVLFLAAGRLNAGGRAVGIDLWSTTDQSGNSLSRRGETPLRREWRISWNCTPAICLRFRFRTEVSTSSFPTSRSITLKRRPGAMRRSLRHFALHDRAGAFASLIFHIPPAIAIAWWRWAPKKSSCAVLAGTRVVGRTMDADELGERAEKGGE